MKNDLSWLLWLQLAVSNQRRSIRYLKVQEDQEMKTAVFLSVITQNPRKADKDGGAHGSSPNDEATSLAATDVGHIWRMIDITHKHKKVDLYLNYLRR